MPITSSLDPVEVIAILCDALRSANSAEALDGYFDHLAADAFLASSVKLYGGDLGPIINPEA